MAANRSKKVTPQTLISEAGIALIAQRVNEMGYLFHDRRVDHGIDGEIELVGPEGEALNRVIMVQSKASNRRYARETEESFQWTASPADLEYWLSGNAPVIVVLSRPADKAAWWFEVRTEFGAIKNAAKRTVTINKHAQVFDESAAAALFNLGMSQDTETSFSLWSKTEFLTGVRPARPSPRRTLVAEADLLELGVHRAISASPEWSPVDSDSVLPVYVPRDYDRKLREALDPENAANRLVVLVGNSTTGKTRSAAEMVRCRMGDWELFAPSDTPALLQWIERSVRSQTLLWLNELRDFLAGGNALAAAALQRLLASEHRIMAIGTLWPDDWQGYADPEKSPPAVHSLLHRALRVDVPPELSAAEWHRASEQHTLGFAVKACAKTRRLAQFLAATPDLLRRYADADPYSRAVLTAAMDARRLGYSAPLSSPLLERGAIGYLTDQHRADPPDDWYTRTLLYTTAQVKGAVAPLTPLRTVPGIGPADSFQLADSLEEYSRFTRSQAVVPREVWDALVTTAADPDDLERLGLAAQTRCYYRYVHLFCGPAAAHGRGLARYLVTRNLEDQGRAEEAYALNAAAAMAGDIEAMAMCARDRDRRGMIDDAKEVWLRAAEDGVPAAQSGLAELLARNGENEGAEEWWRKAASAGHTSAMTALAEALESRGWHDEAKKWWSRAAGNGDWKASHRLSRSLEESGQPDKAADIWRSRAILNDAEAMCELARILESTGELESAKEWWQRAIDAGMHKAIFGLENLLRKSGEAEESYRVVERAIDAGNMYVINKLCRYTGDITLIEGVEKGLRRACGEGDEEARRALTEFLMEDDRPYEALSLWLSAAEAGDCAAMYQVTRLMYVNGSFREMQRWQSLLIESGDGWSLAGKAQILRESGQLKEAERLERRAIETGYSGNPPINLMYLLRTTGRAEEADRLHAYGIEPGGQTAKPW